MAYKVSDDAKRNPRLVENPQFHSVGGPKMIGIGGQYRYFGNAKLGVPEKVFDEATPAQYQALADMKIVSHLVWNEAVPMQAKKPDAPATEKE